MNPCKSESGFHLPRPRSLYHISLRHPHYVHLYLLRQCPFSFRFLSWLYRLLILFVPAVNVFVPLLVLTDLHVRILPSSVYLVFLFLPFFVSLLSQSNFSSVLRDLCLLVSTVFLLFSTVLRVPFLLFSTVLHAPFLLF